MQSHARSRKIRHFREGHRVMNILLIGPVTRTGLSFSYPIFDGKTVRVSFLYSSIDQARYARDREAGTRIDTVEDFDGAVAPVH
jgi:hypothetical protein